MDTRKRRRNRLIAAVCLTLLLLIILAICLGIIFRSENGASSSEVLKTTIISRCETYLQNNDPGSSESICNTLWMTFTKAFVGQDPCAVPPEAYNQLFQAINNYPSCNRTLFWSKTKAISHKYTQEKKCLETLEDTLLGNVMDGLTWCGKNNSNEIFTSGCPAWTECTMNPVRSFWDRSSGLIAEQTCGAATVMLNGSIPTPFDPNSTFGRIEAKRLKYPLVSGLTVVLVTQTNVTSCENDSLQNLQRVLDQSLTYSCKVVLQSQILDCISDPHMPCGKCW
ncbi:ADP-ribosyl cyclase/cyclic ADP-ribose hydrolase 1-like [Brienomyrus brachyistius]|uniref:ADP-ribosyl cyclase/cyclic ADP-ribose hydrolase 1-like n=1 Tax=Brienomyrus brachyistius TaxID=42636 RepID=UPI0020B40013|nr:ADP-ribosyl cyclase/cyclic ADP-ribose hydrolase 1-like [Brienomyrus brachyistius]